MKFILKILLAPLMLLMWIIECICKLALKLSSVVFVLASILFGFADALSDQLGSLKIPSQLVQMLPYIVTVVALVIYALRDQAIKRERQRKFHQQQEAAIKAESEA